MKKLLVLIFLVPLLSKAQFKITNTSTINICELRGGTWPMNLQRIVKKSDTIYMLTFRDQQDAKEVTMTQLKFGSLKKLKDFEEGLAALKQGSDGDAADFTEYIVKRTDVKKEGAAYTLTNPAGALINFKQVEADKMIDAIKKL